MPVDHGVLPAAEVAGVAPPTSNIKIRSCYCCCGRSLINEYCTTGKKVCNTTSSNPTTSNNSTRPRPSWNCVHLCLRSCFRMRECGNRSSNTRSGSDFQRVRCREEYGGCWSLSSSSQEEDDIMCFNKSATEREEGDTDNIVLLCVRPYCLLCRCNRG